MERQDRSCRDLAYSTSVAMDDREVSFNVLMISILMPQPSSVGKGIMVSTVDATEECGGTWAMFCQSTVTPRALRVKGVQYCFIHCDRK